MIEHNNKVYLPLFYPVLFFLSLSGWASQKGDWVIFSSLLYHISILNLIKTFFWPHFPCLLTLCFSPFRAKCFIIMSPIFISPIFSSITLDFDPFYYATEKPLMSRSPMTEDCLIQWSVLTPGLIWPVRSIWHSWSLHLFHGLILDSLFWWYLPSSLTS